MELIFGGAFQGKREYVKNNYNLNNSDFFMCEKGAVYIDFTKKVICDFENVLYFLSTKNIDYISFYKEYKNELNKKIIIFNDYSCGMIHKDKDIQKWREESAKFLTFLSERSECVTRVFCGLPTIIKDNRTNQSDTIDLDDNE